MLSKSAGFTVTAVVLLALGIGANTAIFSVVNGVLLRPLPYDDPDSLMVLREVKPPELAGTDVAPGNFVDWQEATTTFDAIAAHEELFYNVTGSGEPERLLAARVSTSLFAMLGVLPTHGRTFVADDDRPGVPRTVLLSHGFWQRRFGGDLRLL